MWTDRNRGDFFLKNMYTGQNFPVYVPDLYIELMTGKRMQMKSNSVHIGKKQK